MSNATQDNHSETTKMPGGISGKGFTSENLRGNKYAKKDFTQEMAKHTASEELQWAINMCANKSIADLRKMIKDGSIEGESLFTYTAIQKAVKGDFKALQWLAEMAIGKPRQQIELSQDKNNPLFEISKLTDEELDEKLNELK